MTKFLFAIFFSMMVYTSYAQIAEKAEDISPLLVGETIPDATIFDKDNNSISLATVLSQKPTVLVFYRGGWCPYCNTQLSALAQSEDEILKLGYQIVAIANEDVPNIQPTMEQDKVNYSLYADPDSKLIEMIGIGFKASEKTIGYVQKKSKGKISTILPVPAVFVLDNKGKILFEYINPSYNTRMSQELLVAVLKAL